LQTSHFASSFQTLRVEIGEEEEEEEERQDENFEVRPNRLRG